MKIYNHCFYFLGLHIVVIDNLEIITYISNIYTSLLNIPTFSFQLFNFKNSEIPCVHKIITQDNWQKIIEKFNFSIHDLSVQTFRINRGNFILQHNCSLEFITNWIVNHGYILLPLFVCLAYNMCNSILNQFTILPSKKFIKNMNLRASKNINFIKNMGLRASKYINFIRPFHINNSFYIVNIFNRRSRPPNIPITEQYDNASIWGPQALVDMILSGLTTLHILWYPSLRNTINRLMSDGLTSKSIADFDEVFCELNKHFWNTDRHLNLLKKYPSVYRHFKNFRNSPFQIRNSHYEHIKRNYPEIYKYIKDIIKYGGIEIVPDSEFIDMPRWPTDSFYNYKSGKNKGEMIIGGQGHDYLTFEELREQLLIPTGVSFKKAIGLTETEITNLFNTLNSRTDTGEIHSFISYLESWAGHTENRPYLPRPQVNQYEISPLKKLKNKFKDKFNKFFNKMKKKF